MNYVIGFLLELPAIYFILSGLRAEGVSNSFVAIIVGIAILILFRVGNSYGKD